MGIKDFRVGMETRQYGIVGQCAQFCRLAPFIGNAQQLMAGNGDNGSMTGMEVHLHLAVYHLKILQVSGFRKLIASFHIDVVHQDILILPYQFESARTLYGFLSLLLVIGLFRPCPGGQGTGGGHLYAVSMPFRLIEKVENTILIDNVSIDARFPVLRQKQWLGLSLQIRKLRIGISIIYDIGSIAMQHGPIHHVLSRLRVVDSLRSPYTLQILLT